jgi:hypothetical protein
VERRDREALCWYLEGREGNWSSSRTASIALVIKAGTAAILNIV